MKMDAQTEKVVKERFEKELQKEIEIVFYNKDSCDYCGEIKELIEQTASLSDKVSVKDGSMGDELAKKYDIFDAPAMIIHNGENGFSFYGVPSGHEFSTFIEGIITFSREDNPLPKEIIDRVKALSGKYETKVFVTPTCPYCPRAAILAALFAHVNPSFNVRVIEANEFPELANKYSVYGVPKTVINDSVDFEGAYPPDMMLQKLEQIQ